MCRRPWIMGAVAALGTTLCLLSPGASAQELIRERLKSDVGIELGGKAVAYSFLYQYMPIRALGLEVGAGVLGGGSTTNNVTVAFFPVGAKFYIVPRNVCPYLAGGVTLITAGTKQGPFDDAKAFGYAGPGFEYRSDAGLLVRATVYAFFNGEGFFVWPGVGFGYAF